jgi:hypothetical protein
MENQPKARQELTHLADVFNWDDCKDDWEITHECFPNSNEKIHCVCGSRVNLKTKTYVLEHITKHVRAYVSQHCFSHIFPLIEKYNNQLKTASESTSVLSSTITFTPPETIDKEKYQGPQLTEEVVQTKPTIKYQPPNNPPQQTKAATTSETTPKKIPKQELYTTTSELEKLRQEGKIPWQEMLVRKVYLEMGTSFTNQSVVEFYGETSPFAIKYMKDFHNIDISQQV